MGKKGLSKKATNKNSGSHTSLTLREESRGKRQAHVNPKAMMKLEHLENLAVWASREVSIPSLGAFFGHRLAALGESLGSSSNRSLFTCQRCESILEPGYNCTVRIEKNTKKVRRRYKRSNIPTRNNVVYKCHFCSHRNLQRGTPQGHMKEICPPKVKVSKSSLKLESSSSMVPKSDNLEGASDVDMNKMGAIASPAINTDDPVIDSPMTLSVRTVPSLLGAKRRKRNRSRSKKAADCEGNCATPDADNPLSTTNKRNRKSWTSLKEIAENSEHGSIQNLKNSPIPFLL